MSARAWPLAALLAILAQHAIGQTRLDVLRTDSDSQRFAQVLDARPFEFPRDHAAHPDYRHEWWYVTGHLEAVNGERFGFELTFFRYALVAPAAALPDDSNWRTRQAYMAHFALTDLARREFHFSERQSREALGLAGVDASVPQVWLEDWSLSLAQQRWQLHAVDEEGRALDLTLEPRSPVVLNGQAGLSRKSHASGAASYYYSVPRIAARGRLQRNGVALDVQGGAWLDREWGSGALAADQTGWDWYALQFKDGSTLMFYALRRRDGSYDALSAGTWMDPSGAVRHLTRDDLSIEVLEHWVSPRAVRYPARWRLRSLALALDITATPELADQELLTQPRYWEGSVAFKGTRAGALTGGLGYIELVGYDRNR